MNVNGMLRRLGGMMMAGMARDKGREGRSRPGDGKGGGKVKKGSRKKRRKDRK